MKANQVLQAIAEGQFSDAELRQINEVLVQRLKANRKVQAHVKKASLAVGMKVTVNHPRLQGQVLEIVEIRRTKASIVNGGDRYSVPVSMLERA